MPSKKQPIPIYDLAEECRALSDRLRGCRLALPIIINDDDPDAKPNEDLAAILTLAGELSALGAGVMDKAGLAYSAEATT